MSDWNDEAIRELRGAVASGSSRLVVQLLRGGLCFEVLQLSGDGLLDAMSNSEPGAAELAAECVVALRDRNWEGDVELADQLDAAIGRGPHPMLRSLAVDLADVALAMNFSDGSTTFRFDRMTGQQDVVQDGYSFDGGEDEDDEDDEDRWLYVELSPSNEGYRDMEVFIATVNDASIADQLEIAITGKGAFRRFKDVLARWPEQFARYLVMKDDRERGRARAWLAEIGRAHV